MPHASTTEIRSSTPLVYRSPRFRRGVLLLAALLVCAGVYEGWFWWRARLTSALNEEIRQLGGYASLDPARELFSAQGTTISDGLAQRLASAGLLEAIELSDCRISSQGLQRLTSLSRLRYLSLSQCQVTPADGPCFGSAEGLTHVTLRSTTLPPDELAKFLSRQAVVDRLVLDHTGMTDEGLADWLGSTSLSILGLHEPDVRGSGLTGLKRCRLLQSVSLAGSGADDPGLRSVAWPSSLISIDLSGCRSLSGSGLPRLAALPRLRSLNLTGSALTDPGLKALMGGSATIGELRLSNCSQITDAALESVAGLSGLRVLDLNGTKVTGSGLRFFRGHDSLARISLIGSKLDNAGLAQIVHLPELKVLDASKTLIDDRGLALIKGSPQLRMLSVSGCNVSVAGIRELRSIRSLESLDCSGCRSIRYEDLDGLCAMDLQRIDLHGTPIIRQDLAYSSSPPSQTTFVCGSQSSDPNGIDTKIGEAWRQGQSLSQVYFSPGPTVQTIIDDAYLRQLETQAPAVVSFTNCRFSTNGLKRATSLPGVRYLYLDRCEFSDNQPGRLGPLDNLVSLTIGKTRIDGQDLARVASGRKLRELILEETGLTGDAFSRWTGPPLLRRLRLREPLLSGTGLRGLAKCGNLENLDLSSSRIGDAALENAAGLSNVKILNLRQCAGITDRGVVCLSGLHRLVVADLSGTPITDDGLPFLADLRDLESLDLSGTRIHGSGLAPIKNSTKLKYLDLHGAPLEDAALKNVAFPTALVRLNVTNTKIRGVGLRGLAKCSQLYAAATAFDAEGLAAIQSVQSLTWLQLRDCAQVTDAGLASVARMSSLQSLELQSTRVTAGGLRQLAMLPHLTSLGVDRAIPASLVDELTHRKRTR